MYKITPDPLSKYKDGQVHSVAIKCSCLGEKRFAPQTVSKTQKIKKIKKPKKIETSKSFLEDPIQTVTSGKSFLENLKIPELDRCGQRTLDAMNANEPNLENIIVLLTRYLYTVALIKCSK